MKLPLILLLLFACSPDRKGEIEFSVDSTGLTAGNYLIIKKVV